MKVKRKSSTAAIVAATVRQKNRAVSEAANTAREVANQLVRVDTGELKSRNLVEDDGGGHAKFENDCPHALPNEFGTSKMSAQPFFRPGVEAGKKKLREGMKIRKR